jgi:hypothetical protein
MAEDPRGRRNTQAFQVFWVRAQIGQRVRRPAETPNDPCPAQHVKGRLLAFPVAMRAAMGRLVFLERFADHLSGRQSDDARIPLGVDLKRSRVRCLFNRHVRLAPLSGIITDREEPTKTDGNCAGNPARVTRAGRT